MSFITIVKILDWSSFADQLANGKAGRRHRRWRVEPSPKLQLPPIIVVARGTGGRRGGVPEQLGVVVGVRVDEPGQATRPWASTSPRASSPTSPTAMIRPSLMPMSPDATGAFRAIDDRRPPAMIVSSMSPSMAAC